ncbi:PAS domain-containing protein [Ancylothrix sp. C2]|uniref:PAS domain-containing protein n=1 Tax=Ancylothrix sp. D3o TaxID=2953691 RepID=UPI0021BB376E|nr:PAS domain-containing protein [Ancylothrix sp. D3o]MCT7951051.1 PAS domain-containing protein [Ancylothrix sp. D3o]
MCSNMANDRQAEQKPTDLKNKITEIECIEHANFAGNEDIENNVYVRVAALEEANARLLAEIERRKQAEQALKEQQEFLRMVIANAPLTLWALDANGVFTFSEGKLLEKLGIKAGEEVGKSVFEVYRQVPEIVENSRRALRGETFAATVELAGLAFESWYRPVLNNRGEVIAVIGAAFDITDRKQMEEDLRESERKNSSLLSAIPDLIFRMSRDGTYLDIKAPKNSQLLMAVEQQIGQNIYDVLPRPVAEKRMYYLERALSTGQLQVFEYQLPFPDVYQRHYEARIAVSGDSEVLTIVRDITERKYAQQALQEAKDHLQAVLDAVPGCVSWVSSDLKYLGVNGYLADIFKLSPESFMGQEVGFLQAAGKLRELLADFFKSSNWEYCQEIETNISGEARQHLVFAQKYNSGKMAVCVGVDISKLKKAEAERMKAEIKLRETQEHDRLLAEIALRIHQSLDLQEILQTTVDEVRHFLQADRVYIGYLDENADGRIVAESVLSGFPSVLDFVTASTLYREEIKPLFDSNSVRVVNDISLANFSHYLAEFYDKYQIKASLTVRIILDEEPFGLLGVNQCAAARNWEVFEIELLERLATQVAIAIKQAKLYKKLENHKDDLERQVTARTAELQERNQELQELNRLKDLFLHAVTHDLRTPVMGSLLVLNNLLNLGEINGALSSVISVPSSILKRMKQGAERQLKMINSLLEVHATEVRGMRLQCEPVCLREMMQNILEDLQPLLLENQALLRCEISPNLPLVMADSAQLWRVFENLIVNALKHNPPGLELSFTAICEGGESNFDGQIIRCALKDNGVGMTQEQCEKLFDLYTRGSNMRRSMGLGLGLYLCRQIIAAHQGEIGAISTPGAGATFWFTLPVFKP